MTLESNYRRQYHFDASAGTEPEWCLRQREFPVPTTLKNYTLSKRNTPETSLLNQTGDLPR